MTSSMSKRNRLTRNEKEAATCFPVYSVAEHAELPQAPFSMCFTQSALNHVLATVGCNPPETGAKIFCRQDVFGIETVEFDATGSAYASGAVYKPDIRWGMERIRHHMEQPELRLWAGDIHSHPGGMGHPSRKCGPGLGDLGNVEAIFEQNEMMEYFLLPILTGTGTGHVTIHPWVCRRGDPVELMMASVKVCDDDSRFPERVFNLEWEERVAREKAAKATNKEKRHEAAAEPQVSLTTADIKTLPVTSPTLKAPDKGPATQVTSRPGTTTRNYLNPYELENILRKCPEVTHASQWNTLILQYGDMTCKAYYTENLEVEAPRIQVDNIRGRRVFQTGVWEKFAGLALEDRLVACCTWCVNQAKAELGKGKQ